MLDATIASALQKIILNSYFKKRVSHMEDRFLDQLKTLAMYEQRNQSTSVDAELSKIGDHGEEIYKSKDQETKILRPETKDLKLEHGKHSKREEGQR